MEPPIRTCMKYGFIRAIWVRGPFSDVGERLHNLNNTTKLSSAKILITFHSTGWLIGILNLAYNNPYKPG